MKSDLTSGAKQLHLAKVDGGSFPSANPGLSSSSDLTLTYLGGGDEFCLEATNSTLQGVAFFITETGSIQEGECPRGPVVHGGFIQTVTSSRCPDERTMVVDARDNHTYWIQKIGDRCWMQTNLAYTGGGTDTYNDTKTISVVYDNNFTEPGYFAHWSGSHATVYPAEPSVATTGTSQYGNLYNWCAAMGA